MKKVILIIILGFLWCGTANAGDCDTSISSATTSQLVCADDDSLTVTSDGSIAYDDKNAVETQQEDGVTITNRGTIKTTTNGNDGHSAIKGQSSLNLTVTNSGTILAKEDYGIKLIQAEKIIITNEAGGIIKATPTDSGAQIAIGGTLMGNCSTCVDGSTTSSGEGLTLYNYGTIDAHSRTVYGGHADSHTSKKTKIYNYDGGMIDSTTSASIKFNYAEDFELYNYSGATIQSGTGDFAIDLKGASTVTIDNAGTIKSGARYGASCQLCSGLTLTNSGTIEATTNSALFLNGITGTNTITNSGTITNGDGITPLSMNDAAGITLVNSGTISSAGQYGINADNAFSPTITNSGTISASADSAHGIGINLAQNQAGNLGTGATITNSGTIQASGANADGIRLGDGTGVYNDATITNSGTISSGDNSIWIDGSGTTGTNIITKGEATYTGEIEMESAAATMTLDCSISKDIDIEIHGKTNMTVASNLCGNDTYKILDSSLAADADNSETNGYLVIDEGLEVVSNNASYRSENISTKFKGFFNAANYIDGVNSEDKFFRIFYSNVKRENTYKGSMAGVVGQLSPINWGNATSHFFLGYNKHYGDFNNGEFLGGGNYALGLKNIFIKNGLKVSFSPMIGLNDLDITDYDSDSKAKVKTNLLSEFLAVNSKIDKEIKTDEDSSLNLSFQSTLGLQRFPDYLSKFSDGDLSVDEAIERVLSGGFEVKYNEELGNGFIIKPYAGVTINHNMNDNIDILKDDDYKPASPADTITSGYYAGLTFARKVKDINFDLDLMYGNEDGLINQIAAISLTKTFGKNKTAKFEKKSKTLKDVKILTSQDYDIDLKKIEELRKANEVLNVENETLKNQNEKLKLLAQKTLEENETSKRLIVELIKENEKIKFEKQIFKNKILENENKELQKQIEKGVGKNEVNKFALLLFITVLIVMSYGLASFITSILKVSFKR